MKMFDNRFEGKECIIFGSGPSLNRWDDARYPEAIRISCNTCIFSNNINIHDYFFIQDTGCKHASRSYNEPLGYINKKAEYDNFRPRLEKFYGIGINGKKKKWSLSSDDASSAGATPYYMHRGDIAIADKIICMESVVFTMIQFAVKNGCKKLYIVGCDGKKGSRYNEPRISVTEQDRVTEAKWARQWQSIYRYLDSLDILYIK